jgi:hypothetical protein
MKRHLSIFCALLVSLAALAQAPERSARRPHMTPEEYQAKQKEFITQHAELTEEESMAFFPLYFELQRKKHEANRRVWKQVRAVPPHERTEEECDQMIDAMADVKVECATLEKEYLGRFKEILPAKKLMRVQMAEERFQRELLRGMQQGKRPAPQK